MDSLETAGISTAFIAVLGVLYKILKKSDITFNSSCKRHVVEQAKLEMNEYIREKIEQEINNLSPPHGSAKAPTITIPALPDTPDTV